MKKRLFQVFDEMNVNDGNNGTSTLGCCYDMVAANTAKGGGHVKMGVPAEAITQIMFGTVQPILILLDKKEYHRLADLPLEDKLQAAEAKIERYEKALKLIEQMSDPGDYMLALCRMKSIATEALNQQTTTNEQWKEGQEPEPEGCPYCGSQTCTSDHN